MDSTYIDSIKTENTGGGCMVDFIRLEGGRVIVLNDEYISVYESEQAFWNATDGDNSGYVNGFWYQKEIAKG